LLDEHQRVISFQTVVDRLFSKDGLRVTEGVCNFGPSRNKCKKPVTKSTTVILGPIPQILAFEITDGVNGTERNSTNYWLPKQIRFMEKSYRLISRILSNDIKGNFKIT
jgi:hypothetical protein